MSLTDQPIRSSVGRTTRKAASADQGSGLAISQAASSRDTDRRLAGRRILVVEDELFVAMDLEFALGDEGADVIGPAGDLDEGLRLVGSTAAVDAAILDVDLHGKDVFPIAEILQERDVPFLFHTGHASQDTLPERFKRVLVCAKPTRTDKLLSAVADLFD